MVMVMVMVMVMGMADGAIAKSARRKKDARNA